MHALVVASRISTASHLTTLFMTVRSSISLKGWSTAAQAAYKRGERRNPSALPSFPLIPGRHDQKPGG
jgi:hypothetical protein